MSEEPRGRDTRPNTMSFKRIAPVVMVLISSVACGNGDTGSTEPGDEVRQVAHRVLIDGLAGGGQPWTTGLVETESSLHELVPGAVVDWESEVVLRFTLAESSTCPFDEMQNLEYSEPDLRLYPVVPLVGEPEVCTDDAMPHTIVVAAARDDLPDGDFSIWVDGEDPPGGVNDGVTRFGAGELDDPGSSDIAPLNAAGDLPVGETRIAHDVTTHCGLDWIYREIAGGEWALADNGSNQPDYVPPEWQPVVDGEQIDLIVERAEEDLLLVTAVGTDLQLRYEPAEEFLGCD